MSLVSAVVMIPGALSSDWQSPQTRTGPFVYVNRTGDHLTIEKGTTSFVVVVLWGVSKHCLHGNVTSAARCPHSPQLLVFLRQYG